MNALITHHVGLLVDMNFALSGYSADAKNDPLKHSSFVCAT